VDSAFSIATNTYHLLIANAQINPTANTAVGADSGYLPCRLLGILSCQSTNRAMGNAFPAGLAI
ncbi:unnamed protein product, partial [marine sediment metagenome]